MAFLNDLLSSIQGGLQNVGYNLQGGKAPLPFVQKQDPQEAKLLQLRTDRANLTKRNRNLQNQYDTGVQNAIDEGGYRPIDPSKIIDISGGNTPIPTPAPRRVRPQPAQARAVEPSLNRILDVAKYQGVSPTEIPLPSQEIQDIIWDEFPQEATQAAVALAGENAGFKTTASNKNNDGTIDYGLFQNNSKTLKDLISKQRYSAELAEAGILKPEDVQGDARKSAIASRITRKYEDDAGASPFSWWYGWQNKGYNISPERGTTEEVANLKYKSGNYPYFKLKERVDRN